MSAELTETDDYKACYEALNESVDEALDSQFKAKD